ncbi:MAG: hypothetical protein IKL68_05515 [Clostridia bacterium]|nr:hypothetical protein [Clostridia bacterium]
MKKSNKIVKLTAVVLFVSAITLVLVTGTYAKYASEASGSSSAVVAKWDIKAGAKDNEQSITAENATVTFNLFDTIKNSDGEAETAVAANKIAPGTSGSFELSVKNDSEVNAEYTVNFALVDTTLPEGTTLPLEFKVNSGEWSKDLTGAQATALARGTSGTVTVQWRWPYEVDGGDANDTKLGLDPKTIKVQATLVVSQVD